MAHEAMFATTRLIWSLALMMLINNLGRHRADDRHTTTMPRRGSGRATMATHYPPRFMRRRTKKPPRAQARRPLSSPEHRWKLSPPQLALLPPTVVDPTIGVPDPSKGTQDLCHPHQHRCKVSMPHSGPPRPRAIDPSRG
jgi:hypothetical protein